MPALFGAMGAPQMQPAMMPMDPPMETPKRKRGLFGALSGVGNYLMGESGTPGVNRLSTIGAGLKDIGAAIDGGDGDNLMNLQLLAQRQQQAKAQQDWQAEQQMRQRQEWQAGDAQTQAINNWVSTLPPDKQMMARAMPQEALKAEFERMKPKDPVYKTVGRDLVQIGEDGVTPLYRAPSAASSAPKKQVYLRGADAKLMEGVRETQTAASTLRSLAREFLSYNAKKETGGVPGTWLNAGAQVWDSNIGTMNSLKSRMQGLMRPPGSGATSDFEQRLYAQGVPSTDKLGTTNQQIAKNFEMLADIAQARQFFYEDYAQVNGTLNGAEQAFQQSPDFKSIAGGKGPSAPNKVEEDIPTYNPETGEFE